MSVIVWTIALTTIASNNPLLYVFLQTSIRPNALQKALEKSIPNAEIVVFGRYRDFAKGLQRQLPDAVIAIRPVLEASHLSVSLKGVLDNDQDIPYVVITNGNMTTSSLENGNTIGVVDILGRKQMENYVSSVMNTAGKPKLKLVTKNEDLLPLLQLNLADAILLPKHEGKKLLEKSNLNLITTVLKAEMGLPSVACLTNAGMELCQQIKQLNKNLVTQMGVDQWTK